MSQDSKLIPNQQQIAVQPTGVSLIRMIETSQMKTSTLEFLTGVTKTAISDPSQIVLSIGQFAQAFSAGKATRHFFDEIKKYRDLGKIRDDKASTITAETLLTDVLSTIDAGILDTIRLEAMTNLFLRSVWADSDEKKQAAAYQLFQVLKRLTSMDIQVLEAAYRVSLTARGNRIDSQQWEVLIAEEIDVPRELVTESRNKNSTFTQNSNSLVFFPPGPDVVNYNGLTSLGTALARLILKL